MSRRRGDGVVKGVEEELMGLKLQGCKINGSKGDNTYQNRRHHGNTGNIGVSRVRESVDIDGQ